MAEAPEFARPSAAATQGTRVQQGQAHEADEVWPLLLEPDIDTDGAVYPVRRRRRHEGRDVDAARQLPGVVVSLGRTQVRERDGREEERGRTGGQ